jgi:hypothetical protein
MAVTRLPSLLIVAGESADALAQLFATRGFTVSVAVSMGELESLIAGVDAAPDAAVVDFALEDGDTAVLALATLGVRPILVGIADNQGFISGEESLDAAFRRPVDPARLYTRVVSLLAEKRKGKGNGHKRNRLTGVVAAVDGNVLFQLAVREVALAVPPVNAPAILEKALHDLGANPRTLTPGDLAAMLASGRLAEALLSFSEPKLIHAALARVRSLLDARAG